MTRPDQKQSERETLHAVLAALGLHPDEEPEEGEAPDFTMPIAGRRIGVEMTMYQSGATVEDGRGRRQVESEWDQLKAAGDAFRRNRPELADVNVGLTFRASVPPRRQHAAFLEEIAAFVRGHASKLNDQDLECWPPSFSTPLMQTYLRTLYLRKDRFAEWYTNLTGGYVAQPDQTIAQIVAKKSAKQFRPVDELWLAIQCSTRISETMLELMGLESFASVPSLESYAFLRVFVLTFTGAYEWKKGEGWRKLTGDSSAAQGPSFDDLKNVLSGSEWLEDPDGKAMRIATECLREKSETD
jgi:hypothetical protein